MAGAVLHLVTDRKTAPDIIPVVRAAVAAGVDWVQLRDKSAAALDLFQLARRLHPICGAAGAGLVINDRVDVALAVQAHGVHLARKSLPTATVRRIVPDGLLVGASVHSLAEAREAVEQGADYLTFGAVYPTPSHPGLRPAGLEELARVVASVPVPVLAIGGIHPGNVEAVLATGAAGIAVISAIQGDPDPAAAAARLRERLEASPHKPRHPFPRPAATGQETRTATSPSRHQAYVQSRCK